MDENVVERLLPAELEAREDHPGDPEEDDVPRGREHGARVVRLELGRLVRPAERRERVERRREPRVEDVLLLAQLRRAALGARAWRVLLDGEVSVGAVPDRDPVAPPDLARDAPGAHVPHPVEVDPREALGREADASFLDGRDRRRGELLHRAPPLQHDERLDARVAALARGHGVAVRLLSLEEPALAHPREDALTRLRLRQPGEVPRPFAHAPVEPDHGQLLEPVLAPDLEVHRIVPRRDLERPGSELRVDLLGGDDRHVTLDEGHDRLLADEVAVPRVVRVDGDRRVREDRRRPHSRDRHVPRPVDERIADVRERVVDILRLELEIGEGGSVAGAPVRDAVVAVDPAAAIQVHEPADDGAVVALVHREARARVVEGGADAAELRHDRPAVAGEPVLDVRVEALPPEVALASPLLRERPPDRRPRRDPRVVVAGLEERVEPAHAVPAHERVLERELEDVADGQRARDVRRRVHDDEGLLAARARAGAVEALRLPRLLPARLDFRGGVAGIHGGRV